MMFRMRWWCGGALLLVLLNLSGIQCKDSENRKPFFEEKIYHGEVRENSADIVLRPILFARDNDEGQNGQICELNIVDVTEDFPFELDLMDQSTGEGVLRVRNVEMIDCERQADYTFHVQALDCGRPRRKSHRTEVHIVITDENDNAPHFLKSAYQVTVQEGVVLKNILQLEAIDDDFSPAYSTVCGYEITTPVTPFIINNEGEISLTEPLNAEDKLSSNVFSVVAFDCADMRSGPVLVTVTVQKTCTPGWKGVPKRIEYLPGSGDQHIAKKAYLETCTEPKCNSSDVMVSVKLQTSHIGFGCDRETYSTQSQRKLCGAAPGSYDLLPTPNVGEKWTEDLTTDEGHDSDQIYEFDGVESAVIVPKKSAPQNLTDRFSMSFWMKHGLNRAGNKEHIMCNSDKVGLSRHHYSIYIHNCRLVFLLRREVGDMDSFYPTEFRWKLAETCDKEWHRYTLNVNYPEHVSLYVDGELHQTNRISDDWPLHHSNYPTTLTVGACWEGGDSLYIDHFNGYLAGLSILVGRIESHDVITCMYGCKEGLSFQVGDLPVRVAQFNPSRTELTLEGDLVGGKLSKVVQKVGYVNSRTFPTPGQRPLTITTTAICDGVAVPIPELAAYIMVLQPPEPTITISGPQHIARTVDNIQAGILPFTGVTVVSLMSEDMEEEQDAFLREQDGIQDNTLLTISHNLDSCSVTVDTPMLEGEILEIPADELAKWHLTKLNSTEGFIIKGVDTIEHYQSLLRAVMYASSHAQDMLTRSFKIVCTELNGRFTSNEFTVQINVLHRKVQSSSSQHAKSGHHVQMVGYKPGSDGLRAKMEKRLPADKLAKATASSTAMTVVIVICVGFLVFMIVLGVFRIYAAHRDSNMDDKQDMDWDDSALNITVNPMDGPADVNEDDDDSSDDEDDESGQDDMDSSDEDEDEEEEEDTTVEIKGTALEWDDSTLKF